MADLEASAVTIIASWSEGDVTGKRHVAKRISMDLTGQGTQTNKITAASLGFSVLEQCSNFVENAASLPIWVAGIHHDGSKLLLYNVEDATDGTRGNPVDVTGTLVGVVKGY